ncbi:hypothetical protein M9458_048880, partial [Cirrhinus mrigala]
LHLDLTRFPGVPLQNTSPTKDPAAFSTQITMDLHHALFSSVKVTGPSSSMLWTFVNFVTWWTLKKAFSKTFSFMAYVMTFVSKMPGHHRHWSLVRYIDFALLLSGSAFTVGMADDQPCHPPVSATPRNLHVMSGIVTVMPEPPQAKPVKPKSARAMPAKPEPSHAKSAKPKPAQVMSTKPQPAHAMPATPWPAPVMATNPKPVHKMAAIPEPVHKMAAIPKPVHKMAAPSESPAKMAATPEPHQSRIISFESHLMFATPKANQVMPDPLVS